MTKAKIKALKNNVSIIWENRIVGHGNESPDQLLANPLNYRRHSIEQRNALRQMLNQVGWIQNVVVNKTTGHLIDGHLRVDLAMQDGETFIPVVYVELTEEQERIALASLDPLASLAITDSVALDSLLDGIDINILGDELKGLLNTLLELPPLPDDPLNDEIKEIDNNEGSNLELIDVSLDDPKHDTKYGQLWSLGDHLLYIGSVHEDWPIWTPLLTDNFLFAPYPSPLLATIYTGDKKLLMIQPNIYLAGHTLDKWASVNGKPKLVMK